MASIDSPNAPPRRMPRPWAAVVLLTALWSLVAASRAEAHVTMTPPFVDAEAKTTVSFEMPNERPPHATISLEVKAPPGVELASAPPPAGWKLEVTQDRARWTGGRIDGERNSCASGAAVPGGRARQFTSGCRLRCIVAGQ